MNGGDRLPGEKPSKLYVSAVADPCDWDRSSDL